MTIPASPAAVPPSPIVFACRRRRRPLRPLATAGGIALAILVALAAALAREEPPGPEADAGQAPDPQPNAAVGMARDTGPELRESLDPRTGAAVALTRPSPPDFEELLDRLVDAGLRVQAARAAEDTAEAEEWEAKGQGVLARILHQAPEPGLRALHTLISLPAPDGTAGLSPASETASAAELRRHLCIAIVRHGLERRLAHSRRSRTRHALDALVDMMLASIPQDEWLAAALSPLLSGPDYLGLAQESLVLDLVETSVAQRFLQPHVVVLLQTLWQNLAAEGGRSAHDLLQLALVFRTDVNPVKRLTAVQHLLVAEDGRYRHLVVEEAIASRDAELIAGLSTTAATALEPRTALTTLDRLSTVSCRGLTGAMLTLAHRDADALIDAYTEKLGDGTRPAFRAELVSGAGLQGGDKGLEIAWLALHNDPAPEVRQRALLAITAQGDPAAGEKALATVLAEPAFASNPDRLGEALFGLENLARSGDSNALQRIGEQLRGLAALRPADRRRLGEILEEFLPRGPAGTGGR